MGASRVLAQVPVPLKVPFREVGKSGGKQSWGYIGIVEETEAQRGG